MGENHATLARGAEERERAGQIRGISWSLAANVVKDALAGTFQGCGTCPLAVVPLDRPRGPASLGPDCSSAIGQSASRFGDFWDFLTLAGWSVAPIPAVGPLLPRIGYERDDWSPGGRLDNG